MKTDQHQKTPRFSQTVSLAIGRLKQRLQQAYEQAYPDLRDIIHLVLDEEEMRARELSFFPHLLLPDLVEARFARLSLQPVESKHRNVFTRRGFVEMEGPQPSFALCGA